METAFNATIGESTAQVEALDTNTITIGDVEYVKLTASTYDVENADGQAIVLNSENVICVVEDGVPTTTNYSVTDVTPTPDPDPQDDNNT